MLPVLFTPGALSDPVLFDTVVQHWLLAIDCDRIAVNLSFESPPVRRASRLIIKKDKILWPKHKDGE